MKKVKIRAVSTCKVVKELTYEVVGNKDEQILKLKENYILEDDFENVNEGKILEISIINDDSHFEIID